MCTIKQAELLTTSVVFGTSVGAHLFPAGKYLDVFQGIPHVSQQHFVIRQVAQRRFQHAAFFKCPKKNQILFTSRDGVLSIYDL
jgi:hypothetical protein